MNHIHIGAGFLLAVLAFVVAVIGIICVAYDRKREREREQEAEWQRFQIEQRRAYAARAAAMIPADREAAMASPALSAVAVGCWLWARNFGMVNLARHL